MQGAPELCPICFSSSWSLNNGVLVCETCGTQSQAYVEEAQEFQAGVDDSRYRRKQRTLTGKAVKIEKGGKQKSPDAAAVQQLVALYTRCLQRCLQKQVAALQQECGAGHSLSSVVRRIWLAYVAKSSILREDFARQVEQMLHRPQAAGSTARRPGWRAALRSAVWKVLPPDVTVAVCFLGCWLLREALMPMDIVRWAGDATLPFLRLPTLASQLLQEVQLSNTDLPLSLLQSSGVMGTQDLVVMAAEVAAELSMQLPPVNGAAVLHRFISDLHLPKDLEAVALRLYDIYGHGMPQLWLQDDVQLHPYTHLMAILIVAIKMCFSLDVPGSEGSSGGYADWQAWARAVLQRARGPAGFPASTLEAIALDDADISAYLHYLEHGALAGAHASDGLKDIVTAVQLKRRSSVAETLSAIHGHEGQANAETLPRTPPGIGDSNVEASSCYRVASKGETALEQHLGPDYAAVLAACAAYLWLQPDNLHKVVARMESNILLLEKTANEAASDEVLMQ